jgi:hypothetical protein
MNGSRSASPARLLASGATPSDERFALSQAVSSRYREIVKSGVGQSFTPQTVTHRVVLEHTRRRNPERVMLLRQALYEEHMRWRADGRAAHQILSQNRPRLRNRQRRGSCGRPGLRRRSRAPARDGPSDRAEGGDEGEPPPTVAQHIGSRPRAALVAGAMS